jgi:hypothetical protein
MSPVSTENSSKSLIINLKFSVAPAAGLEMVIFTNYYRQWLFAAPPGTIVEW